jgi:peptide/nickel transport system substrate-binding protein
MPGRSLTIPPWILLLAAMAACTGRGEDEPTARDTARFGGTAVVTNNEDIDNLNPLVSAQKYSQEVNQYLLFLPLLKLDPELGFEPLLAERWEEHGDTAATFHLRRDVYWHDGVRTTAHDVEFTFARVFDPETAYPNAEYFGHWTAVTATDSFTIRVTFPPHADALGGVPFLPIVPAHLLDTVAPARMRQSAFNKRPIGNGPFRFVEYRSNDRWVFAANPDFPEALGGRPYLDRIVWRVIPDATAQVTEIRTGGADMSLTPPGDEFARLGAQPGLRGIDRPSRQFANVIWNTRVAPLDDARVRKALTMAIDRQQIVQTLRGGYGTVAVGPIAPFHWAYEEQLSPPPFAPDSARALLAAAGLADRNGDGVLQYPDGRPVRVELKLPAGSAINRDMAEMIRSNLAAVGMQVVTRVVDGSTMLQDVTSRQRNFQGAILAWNSALRLNLRDIFHSAEADRPFAAAGYANPRADSLIERVQFARNRAEATPIYRELQRLLREEQPWTFLYYYSDLVLVRDRLQGVEMDIRGALVSVHDWWVTDARQPRETVTRSDSADRSRDPAQGRSQ